MIYLTGYMIERDKLNATGKLNNNQHLIKVSGERRLRSEKEEKWIKLVKFLSSDYVERKNGKTKDKARGGVTGEHPKTMSGNVFNLSHLH